MKRYVTIHGGRRIPLGAYVAAVKRAIAEPATTFKSGLCSEWPTTGAEIREEFRAGMMERISAGVSYSARGASRVRAAYEAAR